MPLKLLRLLTGKGAGLVYIFLAGALVVWRLMKASQAKEDAQAEARVVALEVQNAIANKTVLAPLAEKVTASDAKLQEAAAAHQKAEAALHDMVAIAARLTRGELRAKAEKVGFK